jgi:hypothetical protein
MNPTQQQLGWTDDQMNKVLDVINKAIATTAKCRQVVPKGPDMIGSQSVKVSPIAPGIPLAYGADVLLTTVHLFVDLQLDDQRLKDFTSVIRLIEASAAQLGSLEDIEIIQGAGAGVPRQAGIARTQLNNIVAQPNGGGSTIIVPRAVAQGQAQAQRAAQAAARPNAAQLVTAIANGKAAMEVVNRPGNYGIILHSNLMQELVPNVVVGVAPYIQQVEQIIGSSEIVGSRALDPGAQGAVAAVMFRLEPGAVDLVHTMLPTLTFQGRVNGLTTLRIEEEIVVRIFDQAAVHHFCY